MKKITCIFLGVIVSMLTVFPVNASQIPALALSVTPDSLTAEAEVTVTVTLQNCENCKAIALVFDYDTERAFEVVSGEWLLDGASLSDFDKNTTKAGTAAVAFPEDTDANGDIFALKLKVRDTALLGETKITVTPVVKNSDGDLSCEPASTIVEIVSKDDNTEQIAEKGNNRSMGFLLPAAFILCIGAGILFILFRRKK